MANTGKVYSHSNEHRIGILRYAKAVNDAIALPFFKNTKKCGIGGYMFR